MPFDKIKIKGWSIIKTPRRKKEELKKRTQFIANGVDDKYPEDMENLVNNSITAKQCATLYSDFLVGEGFEDEGLNEIIVGYNEQSNKDITAYDLLNKIAYSFSRHSGVYLIVQRNGNLKIKSINYRTSRDCRFGKQDDNEFKGKIGIYDKWGESKFNSDDVKCYNVFDSKEKNIKYQITGSATPSNLELAEKLKKWNGQVYFTFLNDEYTYPLSHIDVVQHDSDTEFQISLFKNGELRRGFFAKQIIAYEEFESEQDEYEFIQDLKSFEGASEGGSSMLVQGMGVNEKGEPVMPFAIKEINQNINDALFERYEKSTSNNIRKAYKNPPPVLIDIVEGKMGNTSGESIREAFNFYNYQTKKDRDIIKGIFTELMSAWHDEQYSDRDWTIKNLGYEFTNNVQ